ncbi:MAG: transporter [Planctomycetes bacterium]|nr:transporter [Planctomycetota bacterium]
MPGWTLRSSPFALLLLAAAAVGQEAPNTPAATRPADGQWYFRTRLQIESFDDDPRRVVDELSRVTLRNSIAVGFGSRWSAELMAPVEAEAREGGSDEFGVGDPMLTVKGRLWQRDLGPVDSLRFAVILGAELPSGHDELSSDSVDPVLGGVFTAIVGRHGVNAALRRKWNTGDFRAYAVPGDSSADALLWDLAYLYRLSPELYAPETEAATYFTVELNGLHETNDDHETILRAGLLYEAREWAFECTAGLPLIEDVDARMEREWSIEIGFRWLF